MTDTYTPPAENGKTEKRARQPTAPPTVKQVELARQYDGNRYLGIDGSSRVLVTIADPTLANKLLKDAVGSMFVVSALVSTDAIEKF